ncbi:unnamed protein product [Rotaria sp. Silwood2]|nr:unnamed protein product [Rotaria sp. Silwood2]CAF4339227.1 unnamed protein product [Rotaria sp. Silwood2]
MNRHLTIGDRWLVISLRVDQCLSFRHIARIINCTHQTVHNILQLFHETNNVIELEGRGGGNSWSDDKFHTVIRLLYRYPSETSSQLNNRFYQRTGRFVTTRVIRNYRRRLGFHPVHAKIQPLLNQRHTDDRLAFYQQHTHDDWSQFIFVDEKVFEVDASGLVYWIPCGRSRPTTFRSQINQLTPYCRRPDNDDKEEETSDTFNENIASNITFEKLSEQGVTSEQLLKWSALIDLAERYETNNQSSELFYNCSSPWFGLKC